MNTIVDLSALRPATTFNETEAPHLEIARLQEDVADLRASALQWRERFIPAVDGVSFTLAAGSYRYGSDRTGLRGRLTVS